jgi:hypothetical protein
MIVDGPSPFVVFRDPPGQRVDESSRDAGQRPPPLYLRAREVAERAAAKEAASPEASRRHQELAQAYARLARETKAAGKP